MLTFADYVLCNFSSNECFMNATISVLMRLLTSFGFNNKVFIIQLLSAKWLFSYFCNFRRPFTFINQFQNSSKLSKYAWLFSQMILYCFLKFDTCSKKCAYFSCFCQSWIILFFRESQKSRQTGLPKVSCANGRFYIMRVKNFYCGVCKKEFNS